MQIDIITIYPEFFNSILLFSIIKRSQDKGFVKFNIHNLRDYATNKYRSVDDYPYGGGAGMVMMIEPVARIIGKLTSERKYDEIIYMCPDGELLTQKISNQLSTYENIIILCGHFKGIDERIREHLITREISIGDYVLSGGELAAAVLCDTVVRLIPGVLGDETSALSDSFQDGLLAPPVYTRPAEYNGWKVPDILLSGNDAEIAKWRLEQQFTRTQQRRPDLLKKIENNDI